jgi:hypothetical protein
MDHRVLKSLLAILVVEKVITKKKATHALARADQIFVRGIAPPIGFDDLVKLLGDE